METKILFAERNIPFTSTNINKKYFISENERDEWVNTHLFNGQDYKVLMETQAKTAFQTFNPKDNFITIRTHERSSCNMLIILDNGEYSFHYILNGTSDENRNVSTYALQNCIWLSYWDVPNQMNNLMLLKGHSKSSTEYAGSHFDNGDYQILNKYNFKKRDNGGVSTLSGEWLFVYENIKAGNSVNYTYNTNEGYNLKQPFTIKIAPIKPIDLNTAGEQDYIYNNDTWSVDAYDTSKYFYENEEVSFQTVLPITDTDTITVRIKALHNIFVTNTYEDITFRTNNVSLPYIRDKWGLFIISPSADQSTQDKLQNGTLLTYPEDPIGLMCYTDNNRDITQISEYYIMMTFETVTQTFKFRPATKQEITSKCDTTTYAGGEEKMLYSIIQNEDALFWNVNESLNDFLKRSSNVYVPNNANYAGLWIVIKDGSEDFWTSLELVDYISNESTNANIINWKVQNNLPIQLKDSYDQLEGFESLKNVNVDENGIVTLVYTEENASDINNESFLAWPEQTINLLYLLSGMERFKMTIENNKDFFIPLGAYDLVNKEVSFILKTWNSPTQVEERVQFNSNNFISKFDESNIWQNSKEGYNDVNELNAYKNNNPVTSQLEYFKPLSNPLNLLRPSGIISGLAQEGSIYANRQNMKKAPEKITGKGDIYSDVIFNDKGINYTLQYVQYYGNNWLSNFNNLKRFGLDWEIPYYANTYEDIKRPSWNYIQLLNPESSLPSDLPIEIFNEFATQLRAGIRLWNDDSWMNFEQDNGDVA